MATSTRKIPFLSQNSWTILQGAGDIPLAKRLVGLPSWFPGWSSPLMAEHAFPSSITEHHYITQYHTFIVKGIAFWRVEMVISKKARRGSKANLYSWFWSTSARSSLTSRNICAARSNILQTPDLSRVIRSAPSGAEKTPEVGDFGYVACIPKPLFALGCDISYAIRLPTDRNPLNLHPE